MAHSTVITNEKEKMTNFKAQLVNRVKSALVPSESEIPEIITLRLPSGYEGMTEAQFYKVLTINPELQHTPESALQTIDIIKEKNQKINHITDLEASLSQAETDLEFMLQNIENIKSQIEELNFECSAVNFVIVENVVLKEEIKESNIEPTSEIFEPVVLNDDGVMVYRVPEGFESMTEAELVFNLYNKFHYPKDIATDLFEILSGSRTKPEHMEFEPVKWK